MRRHCAWVKCKHWIPLVISNIWDFVGSLAQANGTESVEWVMVNMLQLVKCENPISNDGRWWWKQHTHSNRQVYAYFYPGECVLFVRLHREITQEWQNFNFPFTIQFTSLAAIIHTLWHIQYEILPTVPRWNKSPLCMDKTGCKTMKLVRCDARLLLK